MSPASLVKSTVSEKFWNYFFNAFNSSLLSFLFLSKSIFSWPSAFTSAFLGQNPTPWESEKKGQNSAPAQIVLLQQSNRLCHSRGRTVLCIWGKGLHRSLLNPLHSLRDALSQYRLGYVVFPKEACTHQYHLLYLVYAGVYTAKWDGTALIF